MPFTTLSAVPTSEDADDSFDTGRAQEPTPAARKERRMSGGVPHRQHPTTTSSSASSSSSSASEPAPHRSLRLHVGVFSKRKGVRYNADGRVVKCRFCEILRHRDEPFLYEDDTLAVFRPLHPIVPSHILIVPRAHIRNVKQLNVGHVDLLRRMRAVADRVLRTHPDLREQHQIGVEEETAEPCIKNPAPESPSDVGARDLTLDDLHEHASPEGGIGCRFAFHVPPFNSIDHVHMHAFRGETGYYGRIKYRTESWWCRSYDEVLARLELQHAQPTRLPTTEASHGESAVR